MAGLDSTLPLSGSWAEPPGDVLAALFEYFQTRDDGMSLLRTASHVNSHWRRAALDVIMADTGTSRPPWWKRRLPSLPRAAPQRAPSPVPSDAALGDIKGIAVISGGPDSTRALVGKEAAAAVAAKEQHVQEGLAASEEMESPVHSGGGRGEGTKRRRKRASRRSKRGPAPFTSTEAVLRSNGDAQDEDMAILTAPAATERPMDVILKQEGLAGGAAKAGGGQVLSPAAAAYESDGSTEVRRRRRRRRRKTGGLEEPDGEEDSGGDGSGGGETVEQQEGPAKKKLRGCVDIKADGSQQGEGRAVGSGDSGGVKPGPTAMGLGGRIWVAIQRFTGRV